MSTEDAAGPRSRHRQDQPEAVAGGTGGNKGRQGVRDVLSTAAKATDGSTEAVGGELAPGGKRKAEEVRGVAEMGGKLEG